MQWLRAEALASNPKIEISPDGKYMFKPPFKIRDRKSLLKLLRSYDLKGLGGILLDDIQESLPNSDKILKVHFINFVLDSNTAKLTWFDHLIYYYTSDGDL